MATEAARAGTSDDRTALPLTLVAGAASFVVLGFGFALVQKGDWGYGTAWVTLALIGWGITTVTGIFYFTPQAKKLDAAVKSGRDPRDPEIQEWVARVLRIVRFDVAMLLLIVLDMVAKPSF